MDMAFCINPTPLLKFRHFLILIRQHVPLPDALFLDIVFSQAPLWLLESIRNKPLFHILLLRLQWIQYLFQDFHFSVLTPYTAFCDNNFAIHITKNPTFHERTKHIEIDCHFVREKLLSKDLVTEFVGSNEQLADILTKSLRGPRIQFICSKLGAYDLYAPA